MEIIEGYRRLQGEGLFFFKPQSIDCEILHVPVIYKTKEEIPSGDIKKVRITIEEIE